MVYSYKKIQWIIFSSGKEQSTTFQNELLYENFTPKKKERFSLFEPKLEVHNLAPSYGFLPFILGVIKTLSCFMVCTFQMSQTESHLDEHARPKIYKFQIPRLTCLR